MSKENIIDSDYLAIVNNILNNDEFIRRKEYKHHGEISVYDHSLRVSYLSYKFAKKFKSVNEKDVAIGGLLHDFYYKPWMNDTKKRKFFEKHGFVHAREALENSKIFFSEELNDIREDIILKHMFPLNIKLPKYKETWIITLFDKLVSLEVIKEPKFFLSLFNINSKIIKKGKK